MPTIIRRYMSEAEERQIKATVLLEYHEAKQALVLLEIEARQIGRGWYVRAEEIERLIA